MKPFTLEPGMLTLRGVFYPTGYMFLMFPTQEGARAAASKLREAGCTPDAISLLTPADIQEKIVRTVGHADIPLPSAGAEAGTIRRNAQLPSQGHHALLVHAPSSAESDRVMRLLEGMPISYGQKYRHLVIEDLVE